MGQAPGTGSRSAHPAPSRTPERRAALTWSPPRQREELAAGAGVGAGATTPPSEQAPAEEKPFDPLDFLRKLRDAQAPDDRAVRRDPRDSGAGGGALDTTIRGA